MADTELKPCPFCGGKADIIVREHDPYCPEFGRTVKINCKCGICTHTSVYQDESDLKEVIEYWNKRTAADVQPVKHGEWKHVAGMNSKCSVCSHYFPVSEFDSRPFDINFCPNCGARMDGEDNE